MFKLGFHNSISWESAFGRLPRYRVTHDSIESALAEAKRVAGIVARQRRGDGRAQAVVVEGRNVIGLPVRI
jgi:hypothetical protein